MALLTIVATATPAAANNSDWGSKILIRIPFNTTLRRVVRIKDFAIKTDLFLTKRKFI